MNNVNNYQYYSQVDAYAKRKAYMNKLNNRFSKRTSSITILKEYYKDPKLRYCLSEKCINIIKENKLGEQSNQSLGLYLMHARKKSRKLIQTNVQMVQK